MCHTVLDQKKAFFHILGSFFLNFVGAMRRKICEMVPLTGEIIFLKQVRLGVKNPKCYVDFKNSNLP